MACLTIEDILGLLLQKFNSCASTDGDAETLSQDELCNLVYKEFPTLTAKANKQEIMSGIFSKLDHNKDKQVDFQEFMLFVACLAITLREFTRK